MTLLTYFSVALFSIYVLAEPLCEDPKLGTLTDMQEVLAFGMGNNIREFCDRSNYEGVGNLLASYSDMNARVSHLDSQKSREERKTTESTISGYQTAWANGWLPSNTTRSQVLGLALRDLGKKEDDLSALIRSPYSNPNPDSIEKSRRNLENVFGKDDMSMATPQLRLAACSSIVLLRSPQCAKWLGRVMEVMSPSEDIAVLDSYREVFSSGDYGPGLHRATKVIHEKYISKGVPKGDLFTDLKQSFIETGSSEKLADEMTWEVLAVISSGGPNVGVRLGSPYLGLYEHPHSIYVTAIAGMLPMLDLKSKGNDRLYSYPENTKTECDVGKPYHFWMSAYLTKKLMDEGAEPKDAGAAVFVAQMGYQFMSDKGLRDPSRIYHVPAFEGFNNIMRIDFVQAAAGSRYSVAQQASENIDLDLNRGIANIIADSELLAPLPIEHDSNIYEENKLEALSKFNRILAPRSAYRTYFDPHFQPSKNILP